MWYVYYHCCHRGCLNFGLNRTLWHKICHLHVFFINVAKKVQFVVPTTTGVERPFITRPLQNKYLVTKKIWWLLRQSLFSHLVYIFHGSLTIPNFGAYLHFQYRHTADKMTIKEIKYSIENLKNLNDLIVKCCTDKKRLRNLNLQTHLHCYVMQFDAWYLLAIITIIWVSCAIYWHYQEHFWHILINFHPCKIARKKHKPLNRFHENIDC